MPRIFTGLEIPADVAQSLAMLRGGLPGARWIDPENYPLTLRFIGDINDGLAREIAFMLGNVNRLSFELRLDGLTSFGGRRPRAVVALAATTHPPFGLRDRDQRRGPATMSRIIWRRGTRSALRLSASRVSCCIRRAPRSAGDPM